MKIRHIIKEHAKNAIFLLDSNDAVMVQYNYDAWGNCKTTVVNSTCSEIAILNPFRYRSYYYDTETKLYFLQSRYYDPEVGRFISIDDISYLNADSVNGLNLYAYCNNNPVMLADPSGNVPWYSWVLSGLSIVGGAILCFVPGAQAIGVGLIVGGGTSLAANIMSAAGVNGKTAGIITNVLSIVGGIALCFTPFASVGASMIGSGALGIAGGYISESLGGSFELGSAIGNIVGGIVGGQIYKGLTTTKLYRAISSSEMQNIAKTHQFSTGLGQMEGKFFATTKANAITWGSKLGSNNIVVIRVAKSALSHDSITFFGYALDSIGNAYYFSDMSYLNSIAKILNLF